MAHRSQRFHRWSPQRKKPCYLSQTAGLHRFLILFKDYNTTAFFTGSGFRVQRYEEKTRYVEKFGEKRRKSENLRENQRKIGKFREKQRNLEKNRENQRNSEKIREIKRKSEKNGEFKRKTEKNREKRRIICKFMCISVIFICKSLLISVRNVSFFLQQVTNPERLFLPFYLFTFLPFNVPAGKTEITIFAL